MAAALMIIKPRTEQATQWAAGDSGLQADVLSLLGRASLELMGWSLISYLLFCPTINCLSPKL